MSLLKRRASGPFSERSNLDPHRLNLHFLDPLSSKIMASDDQDSVHRLNIRHQDLEITYGTETLRGSRMSLRLARITLLSVP